MKAPSGPVVLAAVVLLVAALGIISSRHAVRVFDRTASEYGEGSLLAIVERMRVEPVGPGWIARPPYTLNPYGPGYFAVVGAISPLTPWDHTLIPGRLVSLFAALGTAAVIGWVARREGCPPEVALAGMLVYLASKCVSDWTPFYRVDNLAVLFVVASYAVAGSSRRGWLPAAVLLALGSLVKQTAVLAALPIAASLCLHRRFREAAMFAAGTAGLVAAAWLALDWSTGGYASALGVRANLQKALDPAMGISLAYDFLCTPVAVAALVSLASAYIARGAGALRSFYAFAFLGETTLATGLVLKNGSAYNAFLVPSALAALCVCTFGLRPLAGLDRRRTAAVLCGLAVILSYPGAKYLKDVRDGEIAIGASTAGHVPPGWEGGEILADGHGLPTEFLIASGASCPVNDSFFLWAMVPDGAPEWVAIAEAMEAGRIGGLALAVPVEMHHHMNVWPPSIVRAMERYYVPAGGWLGVHLYRHRDRAIGAP